MTDRSECQGSPVRSLGIHPVHTPVQPCLRSTADGCYPCLPSDRRPTLAATRPVHLTLRMRREVWQLRSQRCFKKIRRALVALTKHRGVGFVHFSVQGNHIHLVVAAGGMEAP